MELVEVKYFDPSARSRCTLLTQLLVCYEEDLPSPCLNKYHDVILSEVAQ